VIIKDLVGIIFVKISTLCGKKFTGQLTININFKDGGITRVKTNQEEELTGLSE
jgi:hypothetical protein